MILKSCSLIHTISVRLLHFINYNYVYITVDTFDVSAVVLVIFGCLSIFSPFLLEFNSVYLKILVV